MIIKFSNVVILIADWVLIALALIVPSWVFSRFGQKKGILKFLMIWSFSNFMCLSTYLFFVIFSGNPFAIFGIFHVLVFGLLSLFFYQRWKKRREH